MSKPRYDWWQYVKKMIGRYGEENVNKNEEDAINAAIDKTNELIDGEERMKVIKLVFWDKNRTIDGAAMEIPCSCRTAQKWQSEFILDVARNFKCDGLL